MTRRENIPLLAGPWILARIGARAQSAPPLATGAPNSPERLALIEEFRKQAAPLTPRFEARTHTSRSGAAMPYRLFQPQGGRRPAKLPLVVYLHGAGGLGTDNRKHYVGGNLFGTHVWALPGNQRRFPCLIAAPQTDRGWANYRRPTAPGERPVLLPGLGEGMRLAFEIVDALRKEFPVDDARIYVTGQSMGGMGTWHAITERPKLFAAAAPVCGGGDPALIAAARNVPVWNFHGDSDKTVAVERSRVMVEALRKAGGKALHTEYAGVGHNSWEWAYTEPALPEWLFAQRR